jgi:ketosteroid isomerase-like protein
VAQDDVEIVRSMYDAYIAGDVERALAHCHPDVKADFSVRGDAGVSTGRAALAEAVAEWVGAWNDYGERLEEIRDLGGAVCVVAIQRGRGKGSGLEIENRFASLYEVEDGLITSVTMFDGPEAAVAAARASDAP